MHNKPCTVTGCPLPARSRGLCPKHYHAAWSAGTFARAPTPRKSPAHLTPGTSEYARWWKDANPERVREQKQRALARKKAWRRAQPGFVDRAALAAARVTAVTALAGTGTRAQIAAQLGLSLHCVNAILARRGIRTRRGPAIPELKPPPAPYPAPPACEACGKERRLVRDHDHDSGRWRGWICQPCNAALGLAGDGLFELRRLCAYLERVYLSGADNP